MFEPSQGSVTAKFEVSISWPTTEILVTGAKTPFYFHPIPWLNVNDIDVVSGPNVATGGGWGDLMMQI